MLMKISIINFRTCSIKNVFILALLSFLCRTDSCILYVLMVFRLNKVTLLYVIKYMLPTSRCSAYNWLEEISMQKQAS